MLTEEMRDYIRYMFKEKNVRKTDSCIDTLGFVLSVYGIKEEEYYQNFAEINKKYHLEPYIQRCKEARHKDDIFARLYPGHVGKYKDSLYNKLLCDDETLATTMCHASKEYVTELLYRYMKDIIARVFNTEDITVIWKNIFNPIFEEEFRKLKCVKSYTKYYERLGDLYIYGILTDNTLSPGIKHDNYNEYIKRRFASRESYLDFVNKIKSYDSIYGE